MIANPSPLQIQNGFNSFITRALPRLLAGAATSGNNGADPASAAGQFQPLFGLNAVGATNTTAGTEAARIAALNPNTAYNDNTFNNGVAGPEADVRAAAKAAAAAAFAAGVPDSTQALKDIYVRAAIDKAAILSAGDVTTSVGRAAITTLLNNAINILDGIGAQLTGDLDSLEVGKEALKQQVIALTSAANTILSANYEKLVPELTELRRLVTLLSMALGIEETMLNTIIDKLENLAR